MRNHIAFTLALIACAFVALVSCERKAAEPVRLTLRFLPVAGNETLELNEPRYANPGGAGRFAVRDFQFFVSNIVLHGAAGDWVETDSYHLVRFDGTEPVFEVILPTVPPARYEAIEFGIGVDAAANGSIAQRGDLDPNGRMAWTWDVGYKFVLFEGRLEGEGDGTPLVYHVGYDENYRVVAASLANVSFVDGPVVLDYQVDVLRLFQGDNTVDMQALPSVKFDHADAARLARNYARMVTPTWTPDVQQALR